MEEGFGMVEGDAGGFQTVAVAGEIDIATAPDLRAHLDAAIDRGSSPVVVDLLSVTFIDSTGLGVLVNAHERCRRSGAELRIVIDEARILKIFKITGLTELFSIFPTVAKAVAP